MYPIKVHWLENCQIYIWIYKEIKRHIIKIKSIVFACLKNNNTITDWHNYPTTSNVKHSLSYLPTVRGIKKIYCDS